MPYKFSPRPLSPRVTNRANLDLAYQSRWISPANDRYLAVGADAKLLGASGTEIWGASGLPRELTMVRRLSI